jgi:hypothetical protein
MAMRFEQGSFGGEDAILAAGALVEVVEGENYHLPIRRTSAAHSQNSAHQVFFLLAHSGPSVNTTFQRFLESAIPGNVISDQNAARLKGGPNRREFPAHVRIGVEAIVDEHIQLS